MVGNVKCNDAESVVSMFVICTLACLRVVFFSYVPGSNYSARLSEPLSVEIF